MKKKEKKYENEINIAYIGGNHREKELKETILPVLVKLSQKIKINFYCTKDLENILENFKRKNIEFILINRTLSLTEVLRKLSKYNIDILVHPGKEIKNNKYKTENSLLNATQLGAILMTSNIEPYKTIFDSKREYIRVENTVESWYDQLNKIISNNELREEIFENAYNYCIDKYSGKMEKEILTKIFSNLEEEKYSIILDRYKFFFNDKGFVSSNNVENLENNISEKKERKYEPLINYSETFILDKLFNFSGEIKKRKNYRIKCYKNKIEKIGIFFASYGNPRGEIMITILKKSKIIHKTSVRMENFVRNNFTYIELKEKEALGKIYTVNLEFKYEKNSDLMGVFEVSFNRDIKYKIFNKIKIPIKGLDILYVDYK